MKRFLLMVAAGMLLLSACDAATGIEVKDAWARPALQGGNGAVYFLLENQSTSPDELTGVASNIAEAVEIHESKMDGDIMQMQRVMSVSLDGKGSVEFAPGGYHVMLIGLKQDLNLGDEFEVTLQFANAEDVTLTVPVQETQDNNSMSDH